MKNDAATGSRGAARSAALALLAFATAVAPATRAAEPSPLAESGEQLYVRHCAVCHGRDGTGHGPFAGILRAQPSDLTTIAARRGGAFPQDEIARYVDGRLVPPAHGTRQMPIWGRWLGTPIAEGTGADEVARGELLALTEYLKTLQRDAAPAQ